MGMFLFLLERLGGYYKQFLLVIFLDSNNSFIFFACLPYQYQLIGREMRDRNMIVQIIFWTNFLEAKTPNLYSYQN